MRSTTSTVGVLWATLAATTALAAQTDITISMDKAPATPRINGAAIIGSIDSVASMYMRTGSVTVCGEVMKIDMVTSSKLLMKASIQPPVMPGSISGSVTTKNVPGNAAHIHLGARGKNGPAAINGTRQGLNDYTGWFATDHDMSGDYFGYDGPCPPWNDAIVHHYVFTLYALDLDRVAVDGRFTANDVLRAIEGHVLGKASITGTYTLNPRLA